MLRRICYTLVFPLLLAACSKKDTPVTPPPTGPVTQKEINSWILDSMRYFYLWNDQLPGKADTVLTTTAYFEQLKNPEDRFSFLYKPSDPGSYPRYMLYMYGMDYSVIPWPSAPGEAIGVVKLVIPGSPAAKSGIKRGSYFTQINATVLNVSNAVALGNGLLQSSFAKLTMASIKDNVVKEDSTLTLTAQTVSENPIYQQNTFTVNGKTVAYLFYNYFDDNYNTALNTAFQQFKSAGAKELILDLRYNPGGSVAAAAVLNALIAPGITEESLFAKYTGNSRLGNRDVSFRSALSAPESGTPLAFSALQANRLSLNRVFILTGEKTASAAELTINALKPYMQVVQIGQTTFGKDKGAVIIQSKRIPWVLLPITYKLSNSKGEGGYANGIYPSYQLDEMATHPLSPIGNENDPLIAKAISIIQGNSRQLNQQTVRKYYDAGAEQDVIKILLSPAEQ